MREFINKNKKWIFFVFVFITVRIIIFLTFWQASQDKGGWENFYRWTDLAYNVFNLKHLFRGVCGGHPLYFTFTSLVQLVQNGQAAVFIAQILVALAVVYYAFKTFTLFFEKRIALIAAFVLAIEPFYAWNNFLFASENLFALFLVAGFYYFFLFLKKGGASNLVLSSTIIALSLLVRPNGLFLSQIASLIIIALYFLKNRFGFFTSFKLKDLTLAVFFLNLAYLAVTFGWMTLNWLEFNDFRTSNGYSTNIYYYNVPALIAYREGIPEGEARNRLNKAAEEYMGMKITNIGDCYDFGPENYKKFLAFTRQKGFEYILSDPFAYAKLHLVKMLPFYLQPAYFQMYGAYAGDYKKPDMTGVLLQGKIETVINFIKNFNFAVMLYLLEIFLWFLISASLIFSLFYSYFKDKERFIYFFTVNVLILYNAFALSPFITAKYRVPFYAFFIISFIYTVKIISAIIKKRAQKI